MTTIKDLSANDLEVLLVKLKACSEARIWASGKTLTEVWTTCERGDWMLWLAARYGDVPLKILVAVACDCAEPAIAYNVPDGETRPQECLATMRHWVKDGATIEEVKTAWTAAQEADGTSEGVIFAARAVAYVAEISWEAKAASWSVAAAGWAMDAATGSAARTKLLCLSADVCRRYIQVIL